MATIALIGAGSVVWTRRLMYDVLSFPELAGSTLSLMDIDPVRLDTARRTVETLVAQTGTPARVEATLDRREAVQGADYVIFAVQVGMHEATLLDFEIPRRYGLRQTIADTLGVGGIFRGLRTIPVLLGLLAGHGGGLPHRPAPQLRQPDVHPVPRRVQGLGDSDRGPVPQRAGHGGAARRLPRAPSE